MKYISLLRGINVSGQKKIKMAELKLVYEDAGFKDVVSYIQSGNVIFDSDLKDASKISVTIEYAIKKTFGFDVPVIIRSNSEMKKVLSTCPFKDIDIEKDGTKVLVTFANSKPAQKNIKEFAQYVEPPEELTVLGKEVYLYCPNGYGKSKLSNTFLEKKLGILATTRNIKSVVKLYELSRD